MGPRHRAGASGPGRSSPSADTHARSMRSTFIPPGFLALSEVVDLTAEAIAGDEWREAIHAREDVLKRIDAFRQRSSGSWPPFTASPVLEAEERSISVKLRAMRSHASRLVRASLQSGNLKAALMTVHGLIQKVPCHIWTPQIYDGATRGCLKYRIDQEESSRTLSGHVLIEQVGVDAWLRSSPGPTSPSELVLEPDLSDGSRKASVGTRKPTPEPKLETWLRQHVEDLKRAGSPRGKLGLNPMWRAVCATHPDHDVSIRQCKKVRMKLVQEGLIPEDWQNPGAPGRRGLGSQ